MKASACWYDRIHYPTRQVGSCMLLKHHIIRRVRRLSPSSASDKKLRIHVARSRHIILHERSASAASFGICTGSYRFRILAQCTVWWPACGRNDVAARVSRAGAVRFWPECVSSPPVKARACASSRVQGIRGPRYAPAPVSTLLVVTLRACWWGAALARDGLHQLHGLPTCGTVDPSWRRLCG